MRIERFLAVNVMTGAMLMLAGCGNALPGDEDTRTDEVAAELGGADDPGAPAPATMKQLFDLIGPRAQAYQLDATIGGTIEGESVKIKIGPKQIIDRKGLPLDIDTNGDGKPDAHVVTGPVKVSLREFQAVGDMVRGGRPTVTASGELLETSGSFEIAVVGPKNNPLVVQNIDQMEFNKFPRDGGVDMALFLARPDRDVWEQPKPVAQVGSQDTGSSYLFNSSPFGSIGNYSAANCDAITNLSAVRMTLKVQLPASLIAEAGVFFLPDNSNTAAKLYTKDVALPGFVSYANSMPVGIQGKLVVVALSGGSYYLYHDDTYVIPPGTPVGGVNEETIVINPPLVTEPVFTAYMSGL